MFTNPILTKIASKHQRSVAQVILRWLYERGIVSLAKSVHEERIRENFDIESFSLDDEDRKEIQSLNENKSCFFSHRDPSVIEWLGNLGKK